MIRFCSLDAHSPGCETWENAGSCSYMPSRSVSSALIVLSAMYLTQFSESQVLVELCGVF